MYTNTRTLSFLAVVGGIAVNAQTTAEDGQLLPIQSSILSSALSVWADGITSGAAYSTIASELASAPSAAADLFDVLVGGDTGDVLASELSSVFSELPPDVASWVVSLTSAEASIITSVLGTTQIPGAESDTVSFVTTGSGSATPTPTGSVSETGSATGEVTGTGTTTSGTSSSTGSKNAGPTLGAMSGVGCGVMAFGAAAACVMGMV